jgi:hypothetical protein
MPANITLRPFHVGLAVSSTYLHHLNETFRFFWELQAAFLSILRLAPD